MRDLTRPAPTADAPCAYELRIPLANGGIDEIGAGSQAELRGYLRALVNHGFITGPEQLRQLDVLLGIAQEREAHHLALARPLARRRRERLLAARDHAMHLLWLVGLGCGLGLAAVALLSRLL